MQATAMLKMTDSGRNETADARAGAGAGAARMPREAEMWAAVERRDAEWDGRFVYAVTTTGVFCRPSCPSRRARRENVRFHASPADARAAGFRACRRCRPASPLPPPAEQRVELAREYLDRHVDERVTLERLAEEVGASAWHLQRVFTRVVGMSPAAYHRARRAARLRERLRSGDTVSRATFEAGYGSSSRVYEQAGEQLGMTPAAYRRGGLGMEIRYTVVPSRFGRLLVAVTDHGVCAVTIGRSDAELERALRREYPRARIDRVDDGADAWLAGMVEKIAGTRDWGLGTGRSRQGAASASATEAIPLDANGTAFQWSVWRALQRIPAGETRSYSGVARMVGRPSAVRAVARACASNRVAVVVPCHRVVREDGSLGGYRWGIEVKRELLNREAGMGNGE